MPILVLDLGSSSFFCYFALVERLAIQAIQAMQVWRARLAHQWVSFSIWSSHLPWKHILPVKHPHFHLKKWKIKIEEEKIKKLKLKILPHVHLKRKDRNWKKMKLKILSHHHLPVLCMDGAVEERRPSSFAHVHKFTPFLKPAHRIIGKDKILANVHNASIISCACGDRWDVYITIDESGEAVLEDKLYVQGHPYLGEGEAGASVLLAITCPLMGEWFTNAWAAVPALSHPMLMRLTIRTMSAPSGLRSASLCGQHAAEAWHVRGGEGFHCEHVLPLHTTGVALDFYFESLTQVHTVDSFLDALHKANCILFAVKDTVVTHVLSYVVVDDNFFVCS